MTYTWTVLSVSTANQDNLQDVVVGVKYQISNGKINTINYKKLRYGNQEYFDQATQTMVKIPADTFMPFSTLSEKQVIFWVQDALGQDNVNKLQEQLDNMMLPTDTLTPKDLPWVAKDEPVQTNLAQSA